MRALTIIYIVGEMAEYMEYEWRSQSVPLERGLTSDENSRVAATDDEKRTAIAALRRRAASDALPDWRPAVLAETDKSLLRFLYARKWDTGQASALLLAYRRHIAAHGTVLYGLRDDKTPEDVLEALRCSLPGVLEERDRKGRRVLVIFASNFDPPRHNLSGVYRALWHSLERLTNLCSDYLQNLANGFVLVIDWSDLPVRAAGQLSPRLLRDIVEGLQDCFPVRFKAVHMLNQPWWLEAPLLVLRRFLTEKSRARLHTHGNNLAPLHEHLPPDILPAELGGERPEHSPQPWIDSLTSRPP